MKGTKDLFPLKQAFHTAGSLFHVIDEDARAVIVPYGAGEAIISALLGQSDMKQRALLLEQAQQYSVNVYDSMLEQLQVKGAIYPLGDTGAFALKAEYYDAQQGLNADGRELDPIFL